MVMLLEEFRNLVKKQNYLFHIHTNYTDGRSSIKEYFEYADRNKFKYLIFTEHVRKNLSYDFNSFVEDIKKINQDFSSVKVIWGCEAKILPGGDLDIPETVLSQIQIVCFACHSFPVDIEIYRESLRKLFSSKEYKNYIKVWVHPGLFLKRNNMLQNSLEVLRELTEIAILNNIFIEKNLKYLLPPLEILSEIPQEFIILGCDAHSIEDLEEIKRGFMR